MLAGELLLGEEPESVPFESALGLFADGFEARQGVWPGSSRDSAAVAGWLLPVAFDNRVAIDSLSRAMTDPSVTKEAIGRVADYFPKDFSPSASYDVFFTATGWQWGDAMTFSYESEGGVYRLSDEGRPAMMFNLTLVAETYGADTRARIATCGNVLAHELFHAMLADYRSVHGIAPSETFERQLAENLFNEGLAHYIADGEMIRSEYERFRDRETAAFDTLSEKSAVIFDPEVAPELRRQAIDEGLYGPYWSKYVCVAGLFAAYHIEQYGGTELLVECVEKSPEFFVETYEAICREHPELPKLPFTQ